MQKVFSATLFSSFRIGKQEWPFYTQNGKNGREDGIYDCPICTSGIIQQTMPLYEYRCRKCGKSFELLRRMHDSDRDLQCPECESVEIERQISTFSAGGCGTAGPGKFT